jgi:hypothetical protein
VSGGGSHLVVGGETVSVKEALAAFFLLVCGGERGSGPDPAHRRRLTDGLPTL